MDTGGSKRVLANQCLHKSLRPSLVNSKHLHVQSEVYRPLNSSGSQGKLKYNEQVTEGFEKMFDAFMGLFTGGNLGKAVVKA